MQPVSAYPKPMALAVNSSSQGVKHKRRGLASLTHRLQRMMKTFLTKCTETAWEALHTAVNLLNTHPCEVSATIIPLKVEKKTQAWRGLASINQEKFKPGSLRQS